MKGKTDTNGYQFEQVNHSLFVHHPFKHLKKSVHISSKYINIRSKYCDIRSNGVDICSNRGFCICSPTRSVRSENCSIPLNGFGIHSNGFSIRSTTRSVHLENCGIHSNSLMSVLFIHSKGEN